MTLTMKDGSCYEITDNKVNGKTKCFFSQILETPSSQVTHYPAKEVWLNDAAIEELKKLAV